MALADKNDAEFDTYLAGLSQSTLAQKKTSYTTTQGTISTEKTALDLKRSQLHAHQLKVDDALKNMNVLEEHEDARFSDFESRIAALEVS